MAQNKASRRVDWNEPFEHRGERLVIMGQNLNIGTERYVVGPLKGTNPDIAGAQWGLISSVIVKLLGDGRTIWKKGDPIEKLPSEYDPATGFTTGDKLLGVLVTRRFAHLADREDAEEAFQDYFDEEAHRRNGEGPHDVDPEERDNPPTPIIGKESTE